MILKRIDEKELSEALKPYAKRNKPRLLKVGKHKPFKPFKAIEMKGRGLAASKMIIRDRT